MSSPLLCLHIWFGSPHGERWSGTERPWHGTIAFVTLLQQGLDELQLSAGVCSYCTCRPCRTGYGMLSSWQVCLRHAQSRRLVWLLPMQGALCKLNARSSICLTQQTKVCQVALLLAWLIVAACRGCCRPHSRMHIVKGGCVLRATSLLTCSTVS